MKKQGNNTLLKLHHFLATDLKNTEPNETPGKEFKTIIF
jgi:hypothetical protein